MRRLLLIATFALSQPAFSQAELYNPEADAEYEISKMIKLAKAVNRNIFIQVGGNWCAPCLKFHNFITADKELSKLLNDNYVIYHLNYSKENPNEKVLSKYGASSNLNFPFFIILNSDGVVLNIEKVSSMVIDLDYDKEKLIRYLNAWKPAPKKDVANKTNGD